MNIDAERSRRPAIISSKDIDWNIEAKSEQGMICQEEVKDHGRF